MSYADKKVLIVEDDDMLRNIITTQVASQFKAIPVRDGEEAVEAIEQHHPNAIVLDLLLPKLSGFEVLAKLRSHSDRTIANTPVIVVSNLSDNASIKLAADYKVLEYYVKSDIELGTIVTRLEQIFT